MIYLIIEVTKETHTRKRINKLRLIYNKNHTQSIPSWNPPCRFFLHCSSSVLLLFRLPMPQLWTIRPAVPVVIVEHYLARKINQQQQHQHMIWPCREDRTARLPSKPRLENIRSAQRRTASTIATQTFVERFPGNFVTSNPNSAITFSGDNGGPLIVVLSHPRMVSSSIIEYTMTQSESQAKVASIDQFLRFLLMYGEC